MKAPSLTYDECKALQPCADALKRVAKLMGGAKEWDGKKISAQAARKAGCTYDDILWAASALARSDKDMERRLRLWMADCAARVLDHYEAKYPADDRPRDAIVAARQRARGKITAAAAAAAAAAAYAADAAAAAAAAAAAYAAYAASRQKERDWQFDRLILWLGDKEPEDWPLPERQRKQKAA